MPVWTFNDTTANAVTRAAEANARAKAGVWNVDTWNQSHGDRASDLRWSIASTMAVVDGLALQGGKRPVDYYPGQPSIGDRFDAASALPADHQRILFALGNTYQVLATGLPSPIAASFATTDGKPAVPSSSDAGNPVSVGVAITIAVGVVAAIGVTAYFASEVVDRQLARTTEAVTMMQRHAALLDEAAKQAAEEKAAGHSLPVPPIRQQIVDALIEQQKAAAAKVTPPIHGGGGPSLFPDWLPWAAAAGFVLWALTR